MENTAKPVVEVIVEKNARQVTGSHVNYCILQGDYEPGYPLGFGETQEEAIEDFVDHWQLLREEEIEVKVIETKIV